MTAGSRKPPPPRSISRTRASAAIELRRPMLRSANSGVSAAIDSTGSTAHPDTGKPQVLVDENGSHFTRGSLLTELRIPLHPSTSLYAWIGDWGVIALALICFVGSWRWARGNKNPGPQMEEPGL